MTSINAVNEKKQRALHCVELNRFEPIRHSICFLKLIRFYACNFIPSIEIPVVFFGIGFEIDIWFAWKQSEQKDNKVYSINIELHECSQLN